MNPAQILVLLIEDNPADSRLVRTMLAEAASDQPVGFEVRTVDRMTGAIQKLVEMACDVILLDLSLPDSTGLESLHRMREVAPHTPIVVLSGLDDESVALQAVREGAQDYLLKGSVDSLLLARVIRYAIERQRAEAELLESEARTRLIVDTALDAVITIDGASRITGWNPQAETIFGWPRQEAIGRFLFDLIIPPRHREAHRQGMAHFLETGEGPVLNTLLEITALQRSGREFPVELSILPIKIGETFNFSAFVRDITERKQRERELEVIALISTALREASKPAEMLPIVLDQVMDLLDTDGAAIALPTPDNNEVVIELGRGQWENATGIRLKNGEGITGRVIATGSTYLSNDPQNDLLFVGKEFLGELKATACVPLITSTTVLGVLWAGKRVDITPEEVQLLTAIADIAGNAISRAMLHEKTEQRLQRLTALRAIDQAITGSFDLRLILRVLLEEVSTQLKVDAADVLILDPFNLTLEYTAGHGFLTSNIVHSRLQLGQGYAGRAASERRTITIPLISQISETFTRRTLVEEEGFISFACVPLIAKGQVKGVLEVFHRSPLTFDPEWLDFLETLAGQAAIAIDNSELFERLQRANIHLALAYDATIEGWSQALDLRDKETEGHSQRVTEMTIQLASSMGFSKQELVHIRRGALLHDIGKMGIPDQILLKPGPLTKEEWETMKKHPQTAYELLFPIEYLRPALEIPYCHHEKWDGTGYPRGLKGDQTPLAARIFAVVDVWDALRSDRPYRPAWPTERVREHIQNQVGIHFDPDVGKVFLQMSNGMQHS